MKWLCPAFECRPCFHLKVLLFTLHLHSFHSLSLPLSLSLSVSPSLSF
uniref:Uncharacterized protein n=1 Tax=Anguilla anguilla TaxID=7936 RepID=A0A0E9SAC0_ANGAN